MSSGKQIEAAIMLPERLDYPAGVEVMDQMRAKMRAPLRVDAGKVSHLGAFAAQILLSAQKQWEQDDQPFVISASEAFMTCWQLLGFPETALEAADKR